MENGIVLQLPTTIPEKREFQSWYYRRRCVRKEVKALCAEQKLGNTEALKDVQYRIIKIIGDDDLIEEENVSSFH